MKLVIIESPGKTEALQKYLGKEYLVMPSKGHVRDLPLKSLGVDMNNNYQPKYEILPDKKDVIASLKKKAKEAEFVYLATDPDREGEAISWHIAYALGIDLDTECRVVFNEISKNVVEEAMKKPRKIDLNLVDAQQTRRILDRIVGYKLSPIICKKIQPRLSAGRVQSVALKLIVDREKAIEEFVPEEYWNIWVNGQKDNDKLIFKLNLTTHKGKKIKISSKEECEKVLSELNENDLFVSSVKKTKTKSHAPAPFTTSTMQQDAQNKLGMSLKKTSSCAQQLYEGVEVQGEGKIALITYIRTDSTRVSEQAQVKALELIKEKYGKEYVPSKPNIYTTKKNAQDAHEAIRPISLERTPESLKSSLVGDNYKLYKLIYDRFVASQMSEAVYNNVIVDAKNGDYGFKATGKTLEFAGFTAVYKNIEEVEEKSSVSKIPVLNAEDKLLKVEVKSEQKFTKPPARYTESTIVDAMEEKGIGRPATYAPTVTILYTRKYTELEGKYIKPTELGKSVSNYLDQYFSKVINVEFTADMESRLDDIAEKGIDWHLVIDKFWKFFQELLKKADVTAVKKPAEVTKFICEKCGHNMVIREGRYGKFLGCSNFPKCNSIQKLESEGQIKDLKVVGKCPKCNKNMLEKKSKRGKIFYACEDYTNCKFMSWDIPLDKKCPKCNEYLVQKGKIIKCSNCEYKEGDKNE